MALDMRSRRAKRLLEEHDGENCNGEEEMQAMDNCHRLCPLIAETGNIGFAMQAMHQSKSMKSRNVAQSLVAEKNYTSEHLRKRFLSTQRNGALMLTENSANNTNSDVDNTG
ncbi:hypothetical protein ABKV19_026090 [Rosa sericea]